MPVKETERLSHVQGVRHLADALGALSERMTMRSGDVRGPVDGAGHKRFWAGVLSSMNSKPDQVAARLRSTGGLASARELCEARLVTALRRYEMSV